MGSSKLITTTNVLAFLAVLTALCLEFFEMKFYELF